MRSEHGILLHHPADDVGVAVLDIGSGAGVSAVTLDGEHLGRLLVLEDIPLGHKVAMRDIAAGKEIVKYGRSIGQATQDIARGTWVHTHNLKTTRWSP